MTLSRQQLKALRYAAGRHLDAKSINEGDGNLRRSILSLFKIGLVAWDPIYNGRARVTEAGERALAIARDIERLAKAKLGVMDKGRLREIAGKERAAKDELRRIVKEAKAVLTDPPGTLRIRDVGDRRVITLTGKHEAK